MVAAELKQVDQPPEVPQPLAKVMLEEQVMQLLQAQAAVAQALLVQLVVLEQLVLAEMAFRLQLMDLQHLVQAAAVAEVEPLVVVLQVVPVDLVVEVLVLHQMAQQPLVQ